MSRLLPTLERVMLTPGLPPDGTPGQFLGTDATGAMWLMRWSGRLSEWQALGFERDLGPEFPVLRRGKELTPIIIGHVQGPDFQPEARRINAFGSR